MIVTRALRAKLQHMYHGTVLGSYSVSMKPQLLCRPHDTHDLSLLRAALNEYGQNCNMVLSFDTVCIEHEVKAAVRRHSELRAQSWVALETVGSLRDPTAHERHFTQMAS